jgi:hypothetical protein
MEAPEYFPPLLMLNKSLINHYKVRKKMWKYKMEIRDKKKEKREKKKGKRAKEKGKVREFQSSRVSGRVNLAMGRVRYWSALRK